VALRCEQIRRYKDKTVEVRSQNASEGFIMDGTLKGGFYVLKKKRIKGEKYKNLFNFLICLV